MSIDRIQSSVIHPILPQKTHRCAVVIPTHKNEFSEIEKFCIRQTYKLLFDNWDVFFIIPKELENKEFISFKGVRFIEFPKMNFVGVDNYNKLRLSEDIYKLFLLYGRILIAEPDAIVIKDEIEQWCGKPYDFIGAPWFESLTITPNFLSLPDFSGIPIKLDVGNGGLCMLNPRAFLFVISKYRSLFIEFAKRTGGQLNNEALYSFIGMIDPTSLKLAPRDDAALFSLELFARDAIRTSGKLPMGFHAMYRYDYDLWRNLFPDSPYP
jgi:hypothetical protein